MIMSRWRDIPRMSVPTGSGSCGAKRGCQIFALLCLGAVAVTLAHADVSPLQVTLIPELRIAESSGRELRYRFVPAQQVAQGQEIYYTVRITNLTNEKVKHAMVQQPVPANTNLVDRSVTGAGATISYSIDSGKSFITSAELRTAVNESRIPIKVTHIRWQFRHALAPHVMVLARFKVVFD